MVTEHNTNTDRDPTSIRSADIGLYLIDQVLAVPTRDALCGLSTEFPELSEARLRSLLVSEWEASTGGTPLLIPTDVVATVRELIEEQALSRSRTCHGDPRLGSTDERV